MFHVASRGWVNLGNSSDYFKLFCCQWTKLFYSSTEACEMLLYFDIRRTQEKSVAFHCLGFCSILSESKDSSLYFQVLLLEKQCLQTEHKLLGSMSLSNLSQ